MTRANWWRDYIISVPHPIPPGMMVRMREEIRDGRLYVVEFLERVPEYQPNPFTAKARQSGTLCIDLEREGEVIISWSRAEGFTVHDV